MKQCPIDFFDPEVQHLAASAGCRLYRMQNDTGEGLISEYPILSGIDLFYNDFHMKDGQNQNKRPMPDTIEINHCREGRFECEFQNGDYQYIGAGDLSIHRLSHPADPFSTGALSRHFHHHRLAAGAADAFFSGSHHGRS